MSDIRSSKPYISQILIRPFKIVESLRQKYSLKEVGREVKFLKFSALLDLQGSKFSGILFIK
jgi:hypothetical protein